MISVVIPAYNEEKYLRATLGSVKAASLGHDVEIIVVDNASTDATAEIARSFSANVVTETRHNIARVRNSGGRAASGDILVFLDADTRVPVDAFAKIDDLMRDPRVLGGSFAVDLDWGAGSSAIKRQYIRLCMWVGKLMRMRLGAMQFCTRKALDATGGYDETIYVGEDCEFQQRLARLAKNQECGTVHFDEPKVITSARRFERVGLLRIVFMYHPITIYLLWRRPSLWKDWYENAIR